MELFVKSHDDSAFCELVRRHEEAVKRLANKFVRDVDACGDVAQETFLSLFEKPENYEIGLAFLPFLMALATHKAIDFHRRTVASVRDQRRTQAIHARDGSNIDIAVDNPLDEFIDSERVRQVVALLPTEERNLVERVYFKGMGWREAADEAGIPRGTIHHVMKRAYQRLRDLLAHQERGLTVA
jgi:RNA polymerase sigma-70 factor (ECF subfamily)